MSRQGEIDKITKNIDDFDNFTALEELKTSHNLACYLVDTGIRSKTGFYDTSVMYEDVNIEPIDYEGKE